jgi:hypothetical protein
MKVYLIAVLIIIILAGFAYYHGNLNYSEDFELDSVMLKTVLKENGTFNTSIKVSNLGSEEVRIRLEKLDLDNLVFFEADEVKLPGNGNKILKVEINNRDNEKGIRAGGVFFFSEKTKRLLPILIETESEKVDFDGNLEIFPKTKIFSGDKVNAELKIYDLTGKGISNLEINYFIRDFEGKILFEENENAAINGNIVVTKSFELPKEIKEGNYIFGAVIRNNGSVSTSSAVFKINCRNYFEDFFDGGVAIMSIVFGVIVLLFLAFIFYSIYSRDRLLEELKCDYSRQKKEYKNYLDKKQKENEKALTRPKEKAINKKIFRNLRRKHLKILQKKHSEKKKIIKKLRKNNQNKEIMNKINLWKKQGYDISVLKKEVPSLKDIRNQIAKWQGRGYNTSALNRKI